MLEGLMSRPHAVQLCEALFKRLKALWPVTQQPGKHAQVLLLQASLPGLLPNDFEAMSLVQQAIQALSCAQVTYLQLLKCCELAGPGSNWCFVV